MNDQPASLLALEGSLLAITLVLGAILAASWFLGHTGRGSANREAPPGRGEVPGRAHAPASMSR